MNHFIRRKMILKTCILTRSSSVEGFLHWFSPICSPRQNPQKRCKKTSRLRLRPATKFSILLYQGFPCTPNPFDGGERKIFFSAIWVSGKYQTSKHESIRNCCSTTACRYVGRSGPKYDFETRMYLKAEIVIVSNNFTLLCETLNFLLEYKSKAN